MKRTLFSIVALVGIIAASSAVADDPGSGIHENATMTVMSLDGPAFDYGAVVSEELTVSLSSGKTFIELAISILVIMLLGVSLFIVMIVSLTGFKNSNFVYPGFAPPDIG